MISLFLFQEVEERNSAFRPFFGDDLVKHDGFQRGGAYSDEEEVLADLRRQPLPVIKLTVYVVDGDCSIGHVAHAGCPGDTCL